MTRPPSPADLEAVTTTQEMHHEEGQVLPAGQGRRRQEALTGTCLTCRYGTLRSSSQDEKTRRAFREMALCGFINCSLSAASATFRPLDSSCQRFTAAPEDAAQARRAWAENQRRER